MYVWMMEWTFESLKHEYPVDVWMVEWMDISDDGFDTYHTWVDDGWTHASIRPRVAGAGAKTAFESLPER